ncbi:hypothetical protein NC653_041503 [Populus alba x Populus x berolinensis]|uniref:Uncharacterized protein n=1 Tax=Populus alba x Populus x berolinensis TaxID=444605 RepID=A0AAD6L8Q9_9ROSI|nr:hypothetical protein NC653_041502 [Populus alba x Populus x berolinensis]KAJ6952384.1 hypothetical protein NC653_041503 [Populus alba x Populus x berolinensis]
MGFGSKWRRESPNIKCSIFPCINGTVLYCKVWKIRDPHLRSFLASIFLFDLSSDES